MFATVAAGVETVKEKIAPALCSPTWNYLLPGGKIHPSFGRAAVL
jgi:hypothetical protein